MTLVFGHTSYILALYGCPQIYVRITPQKREPVSLKGKSAKSELLLLLRVFEQTIQDAGKIVQVKELESDKR